MLERYHKTARASVSVPFDGPAIALAAASLPEVAGEYPAARLARAIRELMLALPMIPSGARGPALLALSRLAFALDMTLKLPPVENPHTDKPYYGRD